MAPSLRAEPGRGELLDDMSILRRALDLHPGLLRYQTPAEIAARLRRLEADYVGAASLEARFLAVSAFMAEIRCGHSHCNPYNQSRKVVDGLFERPTRLPFEFCWLGSDMVVLADRGDGRLARGTTILAVNGEPAGRLLSRLMPYTRADGHNDAKRIAQLAMRGTERYETFDLFQSLLAPPEAGVFRLRYRSPGGRTTEGDFAALTAEQRRRSRRTIGTSGASEPFWTWDMRGRAAVLTMPSWVMYNSAWKWEEWLADRLASLGGASGLVIDLRDNEGGNECGNMILARLAARDMAFSGYRQRVRYRRTPRDLDPFLETWDESFRSIGENAQAADDGFFDLGGEPSDMIAAEGPRLTLPVAALVGPVCSSATFSFARHARESGLVRLFGEPSGGNLRGINGNGYFFVRLPGSGLEFDLPIVGNFAVTRQPDRGVAPDVAVSPTIRDIAAGRDPCLDAAIRWIDTG